jgi:thiol:disulfide interchange protein DsbD
MRRATVLLALAALLAGSLAGARESVLSGHLRVVGDAVEAEITIDDGWHINADQPRQDFLIPTALTVEAPDGVTLGDVAYPEPVEMVLSFSDEPLLLYEGVLKLRVPIESGPAAGPFTAALRYQACNDTTCLAPRTLTLTAARDQDGAAATAPGTPENTVAAFVERWGWAATFAWVALLGLALNLTPCVYPMISVTLAYFGGRSNAAQGRTLWLASMYVLGICITFSLLGVVAALTGSLFGSALQQPAVLGGIALLMASLALANFGVYQFRMPSGLMEYAAQSGEGTFGALFMGLTMGVVGAPCIGPIVAALLLFVGAQQSVPLGLALFFALGLGLGLPYVGLAVVAGQLRRLPHGGEWLGWMEWLFGFVLLGLALHFATPLLPDWAVVAGWALLIGVTAIVLGIVHPIGGPLVRTGMRVAGVFVAGYAVASVAFPDDGSPITWAPYSDARLTEAQAAGHPVFIDFEAEWCLPCKEMDHSTFRDRDVVRLAEHYVMLKADVTEQDDAAEAVMKRFEVPGVPTYLLFDGTGRETKRFVGFVPADAMADAMRQAVEPS